LKPVRKESDAIHIHAKDTDAMTSLPKETKQVKPEKKIQGFKKFGYVRLWRGFKDDPLWKKKRKFSQWEAFEDLYIEASGTDRIFLFKKRHHVALKRGQLITSQRDLAKCWGWHRTSVVRFLKKLERRGTITVRPSDLGRIYLIITFLNYDELNPKNKENE